MIQIKSKVRCCGCSACVERCPQKCIKLVEDEEWFSYPIVNQDLCVDCGLCNKVCPVINPPKQKAPISSHYAINIKEIDRLASSSGGVFISIARYIINKGGIIFGAVFDSDFSKVVHTIAEDFDGARLMMGSKYLQSNINSTYDHCKKSLKEGKLVLFTGTPCQIAGLKSFLETDYPNLIALDFICHGIPSPGVWKRYLNENKGLYHQPEAKSRQNLIKSISFRDKSIGWHNYGLSITMDNTESIFTIHRENEYMRAFLNNLCLRPICHECPFKDGKSGSDLTLADFWGVEKIHPEIDDDKGISLVIVKTDKASKLLNNVEINHKIIKTEDALRYNPAYKVSAAMSPKRKLFFKILNRGKSIAVANKKCLTPSICSRIRAKMLNIRNKLAHL